MKVFPDDITPEETAAGFIQQKMKTGYGTIVGTDEEVIVVVKPLSDTRRYIKVDEGYMLQELDRSEEPEQLNSWAPIQDLPSSLDEVRES